MLRTLFAPVFSVREDSAAQKDTEDGEAPSFSMVWGIKEDRRTLWQRMIQPIVEHIDIGLEMSGGKHRNIL